MNTTRTKLEGLAMIAAALLIAIVFIISPIERALAGDMNATVGIRPFLITSALLIYGSFQFLCGAEMRAVFTDPKAKARSKLAILLPLIGLSFAIGLFAFFMMTSSVDAALMAGR